jgi:uncharacterized protein (DUF58 family)
MTRRLVLLGGLVYGLLLLGLLTLKGGLIALAVPLVVYLGAALLYDPGKLRLSATRALSSECVSPGKSVVVKVAITNHGPELEELLLEDKLPISLELVDGAPRALTTLAPGETIELEYTIRGKRGAYLFGEVRVMASDALGLFRRRAQVSAAARLLILPDIQRLRPVAIRPPRTREFPGPIPARQGGPGVNFFGVREYQLGDPLRWINWRVTARHTESLFTNEFEQERIADVGLILDARQQNDVLSPDGALFDHAVRAAASLADVFLSAGNRVGLLIYGRGMERTFPGYGKVQRDRIMRALARARTGFNYALASLEYLPTRFFPARSQIVMISPLTPNDLQVLVRLRACGYQVMVISPDPIDFEARSADFRVLAGRRRTLELATRIARAERRLLLCELQRVGIQIVDWQVAQPLDQVIHVSLGRLPQSHVFATLLRTRRGMAP